MNEATISHQNIQHALAHVIDHRNTYRTPFDYGAPAGAPYLIDRVRQFYADHHIGGLTAEILQQKRIVIGVSGATNLLEAIAAVMPPGIVITSDPIY